jgi:hypothetical protein
MRLTLANWSIIFLLIFIALPVQADDLLYKEYKSPIYEAQLFELRLKEVLPPDAAEYINDFRSCQHWGGEDAYDEKRAKQISEGIESSCTGLESKRKSIRTKYPSGTREFVIIQSIVKEIESGKSFPSFIFDDPQRKSVVLNQYYEALAQSVIREVSKQMPNYTASAERVKMAADKASKNMIEDAKMDKFMLSVQQKYLNEVMKNADRLHPITLNKIKLIQPQLTEALSPSN